MAQLSCTTFQTLPLQRGRKRSLWVNSSFLRLPLSKHFPFNGDGDNYDRVRKRIKRVELAMGFIFTLITSLVAFVVAFAGSGVAGEKYRKVVRAIAYS